MGGRGGARGSKIRKCNIGFLLAPHSDQSAISDRFCRTQQRYRQSDRQTDGRIDRHNWYSNSRPDAARYALASVAKNALLQRHISPKTQRRSEHCCQNVTYIRCALLYCYLYQCQNSRSQTRHKNANILYSYRPTTIIIKYNIYFTATPDMKQNN